MNPSDLKAPPSPPPVPGRLSSLPTLPTLLIVPMALWASIALSAGDLLLALVGGMAACLIAWIACCRLPLVWAVFEIICSLGVAYFNLLPGFAFPALAVAWIASGAAAGSWGDG